MDCGAARVVLEDWGWEGGGDGCLRGLAAGAGPLDKGHDVAEGTGRAVVGERHGALVLEVGADRGEVLGADTHFEVLGALRGIRAWLGWGNNDFRRVSGSGSSRSGRRCGR